MDSNKYKNLSLEVSYGGTFDPVHYGHLKPVETLAKQIGLQKVTIFLNDTPLYRPKPEASLLQRKEMLKLAIANRPLFHLNEHETLFNSFPFYTFQILKKWREGYGLYQPLAFIIGQDSLLNFFTWYKYEKILDYSHLIVCRRPRSSFLMRKEYYHQKWIKEHSTHNIVDLYDNPSGNIFIAETPEINISSTTIRIRLKNGQSCEELIPPSVLRYIIQFGLYQK